MELLTEIKQLRLELMQHRLQSSDEAIAQLESELAKVKAETVLLQEKNRAIEGEIAEFDERLSHASLGDVERAQILAARANCSPPLRNE